MAFKCYGFETFPHAITWHLQGGSANAKKNRTERRTLLVQLGIDRTALTTVTNVADAFRAHPGPGTSTHDR